MALKGHSSSTNLVLTTASNGSSRERLGTVTMDSTYGWTFLID